MRSSRRLRCAALRPAHVVVLAAAASSVSASVSLSQFQSISGFPPACMSAYNAPLLDCHVSDFSPSNVPCSESCFDDLVKLTSLINSNCQGVQVGPRTLIGLFFQGKGAQALCPSVVTGQTSNPPSAQSNSPAPAAASGSGSSSAAPAAATTLRPSSPVSQTFVMTQTQTSAPSQTGGSSVTPVQPMTVPTGGTSSVSVAIGGTQTVVPAAASGSPSGSSGSSTGAGTFGGGAIPFTVNNKNMAGSISPWSTCGLGFVTGATLLAAWIL